MARLKRCVWMIGLMLFLPCAGGPAQAQGPEEGWQAYTNANYVNDLALEGGGALGGGYTWAATDGGVVCYSASQQVKFTAADGLADNWVEAITVDSRGHLWFSMQDSGVSVLGHGGTPFDKDDDSWATFTAADGLTEYNVSAIAVDGEGRLWFSTEGCGVRVLDDGSTPFDKEDDTWTTFTEPDGLADDWINAIAVDNEGRLWFSTEGGGVSVLDDGGTPFYKGDDTWTTFTTADGLADDYVYAIAADSGERLWFSTGWGDQVSVLDHGGSPFDKEDDTWTTFTTADGLADGYVRAIAVDGGNRLWFGTYSDGVSVLDHGGSPFYKGDDTWTTFTESDGLATNGVTAITVDNGGRLWFGTRDGLSVLNHAGSPFYKGDDTWSTLTESDDLASNDVDAIAIDGGNRLWIGTSGSGVSVLDDAGTPLYKGDDMWTTFTTADGLAYDYVEAIAVDSGGRLWFGTWGGVNVLDHGGTSFDKRDDTWTTFTESDGLADNYVRAIAVDDGNRLWFATGSGVSVLDHGGSPLYKGDDMWTTFTESDGLADNRVRAIAVDDGNRLWFATGSGVSVLDHGGSPLYKGDDMWITFTTADGLAGNYIGSMAVDGGNRLWFAAGGGVCVLDHGGTPFSKSDDAWKSFSITDGLADDTIEAIAVDSRGRLWFGTWDGVSVLDHGGTPFYKGDDTWTAFTTADGLVDNWVETIAVGSGGQLWFGTWGGVSELVDAVAPASNAHSPVYANGKVSVPWSASDGASHIFRVTLWAKHSSSGAWTNTGLSQRGQITGTFTYTPTYGDGTYSFATVAEDWMGNVEATPTGRGDCSTCVGRCPVYLPVVLRYYRTWDAYYEENDRWLDAYGPVAPGRTYLAYPDDTDDYYYFVLPASATVNVSVTNFAPTSTNGTVMLYGPVVGDEQGNLIDYYGPRDHSSMSLGPHSLGPGKYYVRVYTTKEHSTAQLYHLTVTY